MKAEVFVEVTFSVQGWVKQSLKMINPKKYTQEKVVALLKSGEICTSIIEGGEVIITATGEVIGQVEYVDPEGLEYCDYEEAD
jgi:ArsR family metal-binding transcriptional regulator